MSSDSFFQQHVQRLKAALNPAVSSQLVSEWLCRNTLLKGKPFNFKKFSYQKFILDHPAREKNTRKPSQCGVSEIAVRNAVGFCLLHSAVNTLYCLPTSTYATTFSANRFAPVIESSPAIASNIHPGADSASVKRFRNDSFIFMRGMSSATQAISIPGDLVVVDELDFIENVDVLTSFTSRLTASDHKLEWRFSTPTVGSLGISEHLQTSKRYVPLTHCHRCNHWFEADYYQHVRLPGFSPRPLTEINYFSKNLLSRYQVSDAYLECPNCKRPVDLVRPDNYEFVLENPDDNYEAAGFQVTPFIVGAVVPPGELIRVSTKYANPKDFKNYGLGLPAEDETTGLSIEEVTSLFSAAHNSAALYPDQPTHQIAGVDLGGTCAALTAYPAPDGHLRILHAELIPLSRMRARLPELLGQKRVLTSVLDALPYTDLVSYFQEISPTSWAAISTNAKGLELYQVKTQEDDETKATFGIRQLNFKRNQCLDFVVQMVRNGKISFAPSTLPLQQVIIAHLTSMKRLKIVNRDGEEEHIWRKPENGDDHFFHALVYLVLANFIKGLAGGLAPLPALVSKFRSKMAA